MKAFVAALLLILLSSGAFAQTTNPDPFNVKGAATVSAGPQPIPASAPAVVAAPPTFQQEILSWIQTLIAGLATAFFGKLAIKPPSLATGSSAAKDPSQIALALKAALHPNGTSIIADPAFRTTVDQALLQLVQSGVPGTAIQSGISMIPGVGPLGSILEPMLRKAVEGALESRLGQPGATAGAFGHPSPTDQLVPVLSSLKDFLESKFPHPPTSAPQAAAIPPA